jgi:predicted TIM-barrel fold metal-dependent hydrolase
MFGRRVQEISELGGTGESMSEEFTLPAKLIDIHNHVWAEPMGGVEDVDGDRLIETMNGSNIERTLIMGVTYGHNEKTLAAVKKHSQRFVGGVFADPRDGQRAMDEVRKYHAEGFRVIKLFPNRGYCPDDEQFRPFFDQAAQLKMAVLSHCGFLLPLAVSAAYYSSPGRFEKLMRTYPEMPFIMAHMGGIGAFLQTIMLTTRLPNAYADFSPGQGMWVLSVAPAMIATIPANKLMWGADSYTGIPDQLKTDRTALIAANHGPSLEKMFYSNAKGLLQRLGVIPT